MNSNIDQYDMKVLTGIALDRLVELAPEELNLVGGGIPPEPIWIITIEK